MDGKRFPVKLWCLVNDPAIASVCFDCKGEEVIINQTLFEEEVLSKGCGLPDNFHSFHRQLNLYGFKKSRHVRGNSSKMGCKYFINPHFKRGYPELVDKLTRNTVKNGLKAVGHQNTHQLPLKNEKFLEGDEGSASPVLPKITISVNAALPPHDFQPDEEVLVFWRPWLR